MTNATASLLWQQLTEQNLVQGDSPPATPIVDPWYIRVMQGAAGWLAAFFLMVFLGFTLRISGYSSAFLALGLILNIGAIAMFRAGNVSAFAAQFGVALNIAGQLFVLWWIKDSYGLLAIEPLLAVSMYNIILFTLGDNVVNRVMCATFVSMTLSLSLAAVGWYEVSGGLLAIGVFTVWLFDSHWGKHRALWLPLGYGLTIGLLQFNGSLLFINGFYDWFDYAIAAIQVSGLVHVNTFILSALLMGGSYQIARCQSRQLAPKTILTIVFIGIITALAHHYLVGVASAMLLVFLGVKSRRNFLLYAGFIALLGFLSWYYYNLGLNLMTKAMILFGISIALLTLAAWLHCVTKSPPKESVAKESVPKARYVPVLAALLVLMAVNINIYYKENTLAHGRIIYIPLAPLDPRSLMQGDYMALNFSWLSSGLARAAIEGSVPGQYFLAAIDSNKVADLIAVSVSGPLTTPSNLVTIKFRIENDKVVFASTAFYFEEGTGQRYESARYGEFRLGDDGTLLLTGLRNSEFELLGQR